MGIITFLKHDRDELDICVHSSRNTDLHYWIKVLKFSAADGDYDDYDDDGDDIPIATEIMTCSKNPILTPRQYHLEPQQKRDTLGVAHM
jgi:hypothetical protein